MPLEKDDAWFMLPNVPKKGWKNNETRTFVFQDDGRDMQTETGCLRSREKKTDDTSALDNPREYGPSVVFTVTQDKDPKLYRLWVPETDLEYGDFLTSSARWSPPNLREKGALAIALRPHVPLKGKPIRITKQVGKTYEQTRYTAEPQ